MATYPVVLIIVSLLEINAVDIPESDTHKAGIKRTLDDILSYRQYQDMYQEMMRVAHDSQEVTDEDESRLRRIVGEDNYKIYQGGVSRRRGGAHLRSRSAVGRRRARSQALRREKLNSQGLRSHMQHTKQAVDYSSEALSFS